MQKTDQPDSDDEIDPYQVKRREEFALKAQLTIKRSKKILIACALTIVGMMGWAFIWLVYGDRHLPDIYIFEALLFACGLAISNKFIK